MGGTDGEETVDQLIAKLAKKGKKIKILDESTSHSNFMEHGAGGDTVRESVIDEVDDED